MSIEICDPDYRDDDEDYSDEDCFPINPHLGQVIEIAGEKFEYTEGGWVEVK